MIDSHSLAGIRGQVDLVDVRTTAEFGERHAEGAHLMPLDQLDADALRDSADRTVLVCLSGKRAEKACRQLEAAGLEGLRVLEGGTEAWDRAGYPVVRGKGAISLERQVRIAAGALVLTGVLLGALVHPGFLGLAGFVGAGLVFAGVTDWCGMGLLLAKAPWNQGDKGTSV